MRVRARLRRPVLVAAVGVVVVAGLRRSVRRVEVTGSSMAPTLLPGDRLLVVSPPWSPPPWPRPGVVVAVTDPRLPERTLIKRVVRIDRRTGTVEVEGDAADASTDSRTFGPVPRSSVLGWAVYRYAPAARSGPAPWPGEYHRA